MNVEELKKEMIEIATQSYNKGINDAHITLSEAFKELAKLGITSFTTDEVINIIQDSRSIANKIETKPEPTCNH